MILSEAIYVREIEDPPVTTKSILKFHIQGYPWYISQ